MTLKARGLLLALSAACLGACTAPRQAMRSDPEWDLAGGPVLPPGVPRGAEALPSVKLDVPFERQRPGECGPAALTSLLKYWGAAVDAEAMRKIYSRGIDGTLGFDLWREARRAGLAALEVRELSPEALRGLLAQGVPVIVNLGRGSRQHYVLVTGWDRARGRWLFHDGRRPHARAPAARFEKRWRETGRWALIAFPPDRRIASLGEAHVQAAERVIELGRREVGLWHLEQGASAAGNPALWLRLGVERHKQGQAGPAEAAYRSSIRLAPSVPDAYNNLALLIADQPGRLKEAEALAREAVSLSQMEWNAPSRLPYTMDTLNVIIQKRRRLRAAAEAFRQALEHGPPDIERRMRFP